jgi:hypothetical protein
MLDFNNILATPGADIQYFEGTSTATLTQWQVWKKPRGVKWIYLLGVGGGGGGGTGVNTATTSGGGAGGSSGGQSSVMIPAMFVPDTLYIQAGAGGAGATTSGGLGTAGTITYVCISPYTTIAPAGTLLLASGGTSTTSAATSTTGGTVPGAVANATLVGMCLAGRGFSTLLGGQVGAQGATAGATGANIIPPTTGLMVTGGGGGGGTNASGANAGSINAITGTLGTDFFPLPISGGTQNGTGSSVPSGDGQSGFASRNFLFNFGGAGGGGATDTAGGTAGRGGDGAPGCGGGAGGGMNTTNTTFAQGGNGGPGFVYIISI